MNSTTQISKGHLITACEASLLSLDNQVQRNRDILINKEMTKRWFPSKTWDIAKARLESGGAFEAYHWESYSVSWFRSVARDLLLLAQHSDTEWVSVSAEDIRVIKEWL